MAKQHGMQMGTSGYGIAHGAFGSSSYRRGDTGGSHGDHAFFQTQQNSDARVFEVHAPTVNRSRAVTAQKTPRTTSQQKSATTSQTTKQTVKPEEGKST